MEAFKKFSRFEKDYIDNDYPRLSEQQKLGLWWNLIVFRLMFYSGVNPLRQFTPENYQKWKEVEKDFDSILEKLLPEIWEHGPWTEKTTLDEVRSMIHARIGKVKEE